MSLRPYSVDEAESDDYKLRLRPYHVEGLMAGRRCKLTVFV